MFRVHLHSQDSAMLKFIFFFLLRMIICSVIFVALLINLPNIPPETTFTPYSIPPPLPRTGSLEPNNILDGGKRLFEGLINGPESVAVRGNEVFVSVSDGTIQKIYGENFELITEVTQTGKKCDGPWQERICGRPLGLRFAPNGRLLVADAYYGILSVDVENGDKETLVGPNELIDGKVLRIANDLDIDSEGNVYWSDSSTVADLSNMLLVAISDPTGRLIKYNPVTKTNTVLLKDIHLANGVQLSPNQDYVLVSELMRSTIHRYWLKGPKAGQSEIFLDRLPGSPDNIRPRPCGGYYISLIDIKHADKPAEHDQLDFLNKNAMIRKFICRFFSCLQMFLEKLQSIYPLQMWEHASYQIFNAALIMQFKKENVAIVVEVDEDGNIIGSLQGSEGIIKSIGQTEHVGNNIFFGSPTNRYLGHLQVDEIICTQEKNMVEDSKESFDDNGIIIEDSIENLEDHIKLTENVDDILEDQIKVTENGEEYLVEKIKLEENSDMITKDNKTKDEL